MLLGNDGANCEEDEESKVNGETFLDPKGLESLVMRVEGWGRRPNMIPVRLVLFTHSGVQTGTFSKIIREFYIWLHTSIV